MLMRQLEYLLAVAREEHFLRAAQSCGVSQPALSEGIRKLEKELNVPLIRRGNKFEGLTPEGLEVTTWARRILADRDAMNDELAAMRGGVSGQLRIGSIPTASIAVSLLNASFCREHPQARVQVVSDMNNDEVLARLAAYEIDAGIAYIQDPLPERFSVTPLYLERHVLLVGEDQQVGASVSWSQAASLPLCLLAPHLQGRQRIDAVFAEVGVQPEPRLETDSVASLFAHVKTGFWATILPTAWMHVFGVPEGLRAVPLSEPQRALPVGLVTLSAQPASVLVRAMAQVAATTELRHLEYAL